MIVISTPRNTPTLFNTRVDRYGEARSPKVLAEVEDAIGSFKARFLDEVSQAVVYGSHHLASGRGFISTSDVPVSAEQVEAQVEKLDSYLMSGHRALGQLNGKLIQVNDHLCMMESPKMYHRKSKRMSEAYHKRIQKKWNKRYGVDSVDHSYLVNGVMMVSSRTMAAIKNGIGAHALLEQIKCKQTTA